MFFLTDSNNTEGNDLIRICVIFEIKIKLN